MRNLVHKANQVSFAVAASAEPDDFPTTGVGLSPAAATNGNRPSLTQFSRRSTCAPATAIGKKEGGLHSPPSGIQLTSRWERSVIVFTRARVRIIAPIITPIIAAIVARTFRRQRLHIGGLPGALGIIDVGVLAARFRLPAADIALACLAGRNRSARLPNPGA